MESGKQGSSDASSTEENDRVDQVIKGGDTAATTTKRSYECTFCKRGFTNAQALGGHMNIHRKDRAKAKQPTSGNSSVPTEPTVNDQDYMMMINPSYLNLPPIPTQPTKYYPVSEAQRNNNHMYFQPPHVFLYGNYDNDDQFLVRAGSQSLSMNEELLGANLSLRIGPTHVDDDDSELRRRIMKEDEVDLELRLGHHP